MTMLTHLDLARVAKDAYTKSSVDSGSAEALVLKHSERTIIAIRGSEADGPAKIWDIARNLQFWPWRHKATGWCHAGFLRGAKRMLKEVILRTDNSLPVYLTGHSKGGAEALLLGAMLSDMGYNVVEVVTFGAPMACIDGDIKKTLRRTALTRYVNGKDIVPSLPPSVLGAGHVGKLVMLPGQLGVFKDHSMGQYLKWIGVLPSG